MADSELITQMLNAMYKNNRHKNFKGLKPPLRPSEMILMVNLGENQPKDGTGINIGDLSEMLSLAPPTVTPLINSLESEGYIERIYNRTDRRKIFIRTTPKGDELLEKSKKDMDRKISGLVDYLGEDDTREFIRLLNKINEYNEYFAGKELEEKADDKTV